jgi:hypothetical protein
MKQPTTEQLQWQLSFNQTVVECLLKAIPVITENSNPSISKMISDLHNMAAMANIVNEEQNILNNAG